MLKAREVNGYRLLYMPENESSIKTGNWKGYVYEHVVVAEKSLKRKLKQNEVVHHLDLDRSNNKESNLLVLERSQHIKIHMWLDIGAPVSKDIGERKFLKNGVNSGESKAATNFCEICSKTLQKKQIKYCSIECKFQSYKNSSLKPKKEVLVDLISKKVSLRKIGKMFSVSDNAVRKWLKSYNIPIPQRKSAATAILSQAKSTLLEGAETTGEVKSS